MSPQELDALSDDTGLPLKVWDRVWNDSLACGLSDAEATARANAAVRRLP